MAGAAVSIGLSSGGPTSSPTNRARPSHGTGSLLDRLLVRRGGVERGEGKFAPISWDEAFDTCERRLNAIRQEYGAEAVIFAQGTGRDIGGASAVLALRLRAPHSATA